MVDKDSLVRACMKRSQLFNKIVMVKKLLNAKNLQIKSMLKSMEQMMITFFLIHIISMGTVIHTPQKEAKEAKKHWDYV